MQDTKVIIDCYNKTANKYAEKYGDELDHKHFDRMLLKAFAKENINNGKIVDLGCGPGHTTKYLADCGVNNVVGVDISPVMIEVAKKINSALNFETADVLALHYPDNSVGGMIAFYSIVHFDYEQIAIAFKEIQRVLIKDGQFLFSFHIGDSKLHLDNFLDQDVNIDFYFFQPATIVKLLQVAGFNVIDNIERAPYADVEYQSQRAYIWASKK